jgi:hypothetical protein
MSAEQQHDCHWSVSLIPSVRRSYGKAMLALRKDENGKDWTTCPDDPDLPLRRRAAEAILGALRSLRRRGL